MADDAKLQLGIDMEALQRSASQATSMLSKAFAGIGPSSLLGSGVAPSQGPSAQQGGKDTIRGVIDALERVDRTLVIGFNALAGGVYLGGRAAGGAGGGSGVSGGSGSPSAPAQLPTQRGRSFGGGGVAGAAGDLASALMPSALNMVMGGFYGTDIMGFLHNAVSQIPVAGRLLGAVMGPVYETMKKEDEYKNARYEMFRDTGKGGMEAFDTLWRDTDYFNNYTKRYGFSRSETNQLTRAGYRGGLDLGRENQTMETVLDAQGQLGLGMEAAGTMGALRRAGAGAKPGDEVDALAGAIGIAVAKNLEQGRWAEMWTLLQKSAQSSVDTDISLRGTLTELEFVNSLGGRYKGDTPASQSMRDALKDMTGNASSPLAMMAAMSLSGGNPLVAKARLARARETFDPEMANWIVEKVSTFQVAKDYFSAPEKTDADKKRASDLLDTAAGVVETTGVMTQLKLEELLKKRKEMGAGPLFKPPSAAAVEEGRRLITGQGKIPDDLIDPRRAETMKQRPTDIKGLFQRIGNWFVANPLGNVEPKKDELLTPQQELKNIEDVNRRTESSRSVLNPPPIVTPIIDGLGDLSGDDIIDAAATAGLSPITMKSWFDTESKGDIQSRDYKRGLEDWRGARGFGQVSENESKELLGLNTKDFRRLSTDKKFSYTESAILAKKLMEQARKKAPSDWSEEDITHLMKYQHGGMGFARDAMDQFRSMHGGKDPSSWKELYGAESGVLSGQALRALNNANKLVVEVVVTQDHLGRPIVKPRGPNAAASGPPATMSLDFDKLMK